MIDRDKLSEMLGELKGLDIIPEKEYNLYTIGVRACSQDQLELLDAYLPEMVNAVREYKRIRSSQSEKFWKVSQGTPQLREFQKSEQRTLAFWKKRVRLKIKYKGKMIKV